jgi:hypothetical protein
MRNDPKTPLSAFIMAITMAEVKLHDSIIIFEGFFCDWLSVWQVRPAHSPLNRSSQVTTVSSGAVVFEHIRAACIQGSYSTKCSIKSDGSFVVVPGNFGRLNRRDNLFNLDSRKSLQRLNIVANFAGLPVICLEDLADSNNRRKESAGVVGDFSNKRLFYEFVDLSRIGLTWNYCGSAASARSVIRSIAGKRISRVKKGVAGDSSVWWYNTRCMLKLYIKALEMEGYGLNSEPAYEYA